MIGEHDRFRVTVRGEGFELRGYVDGFTRVNDFAGMVKPLNVVVVTSPADAEYDPFGPMGADW